MRNEEARLRGVFAERKRRGFVRECHGDLHARNVALRASEPVAFDALEFDEDLRTTDVTSDVAFLVMDLDERGRADLGRRFLDGWLARTGGYAGLAVLRHGVVYRALVRAMVDRIRSEQEPGARDTAARYLSIAKRWSERSFPRWLAITHGFSGSGKTTASTRVVETTDAIRVRSDVERKRHFGLAPEARSGSAPGGGIYAPEATVATFARLAAKRPSNSSAPASSPAATATRAKPPRRPRPPTRHRRPPALRRTEIGSDPIS